MAIHHATASTLLSSLRARGQARISRGRAPRAAVQAQTAAPPWEQAPIAESHQSSKVCLKGLTCHQLADWCESIGERRARGMHIWRWMYGDGKWLERFSDAQNQQDGFSKAFMETVPAVATCNGGLELRDVHVSADGTRKLLFLADGLDGPARVETVLIPITREQGAKSRVTVCVSSQVGCAMGCKFCYTGRMGLLQNLSAAQIVEQLVHARRHLAQEGLPETATNIVFMGMGEPLDNMDAVMAAIEIATHPLGLHFSKNKITVSTVGLVPEIERFCASTCTAQLAVSLHAPNDAIRSSIVPINRRYNLNALMACLREHFPKHEVPRWHGRHVLIEYVMLHAVNDLPEHAAELLQLLRPVECKVNLIVFNTHEGAAFSASSPDAVQHFRSILIQGGLVCTVRDSRGDDEMAACGQLGNPEVRARAKQVQAVAQVRDFICKTLLAL